jgi:hypothetical protein
VWAIVSDPRTQPDWWPDVIGVSAAETLREGDEYTRSSTPMIPLVDAVDSVWVVERLELLKEAHFRCALSGTFARFSLTPAQGNTFVELESGMEPTAFRWRILGSASRSYFRRWVIEVLDGLAARSGQKVIAPDLQGR